MFYSFGENVNLFLIQTNSETTRTLNKIFNILNVQKLIGIVFQTRILVTHGLTFLPQADLIIVLKEGQLTEMGGYDELMKQGREFSDVINTYADMSNGTDSEGVWVWLES